MSLLALVTSGQADAAKLLVPATDQVATCRDDYSDVDFCDRHHLSEVRRAIATRKPEFNRTYVVVAFPGTHDRTSYAVADVRSGKTHPLPFDYFGPYVDRRGKPVSTPRPSIEYRLDSDVICFSGSTYDYRNVLENQKTCYQMKLSGFEQF